MSDFDTRFVVSNDTTPQDWVEISREVGRVHTEICREYPDRARILEHLPGVNLTWNELRDASLYYSEFHQWSHYYGNRDKHKEFEKYLKTQSWSIVDEAFMIKKFALYYTPYDREIDPPINLGPFENKYPLHSRFMHYFCPPVQSAVSILSKRVIIGKLERLRMAREMFPNPEVIDLLFDSLNKHYETPELYVEPRLSEVEAMLFKYLQDVYSAIQPQITVINAAPNDDSQKLRGKLTGMSAGVVGRFFDGVKFSRLMMGRIYFYIESIPHFDSSWLIRHEMRRVRNLFFETTFSSFGIIAWNMELSPEDVLEKCRAEFLAEEDYLAVKAFADIFSEKYSKEELKNFAKRVADLMAPFQVALEGLTGKVRDIISSRPVS